MSAAAMLAPFAPFAPLSPAWGWPGRLAALLTELRIDVFLPEDRVAADLEAINQRADTLLDRSDELPELCMPQHGLVVKTRCADGEHFLYVLDTVRRRVVAYVTLSRLIEVNRQADRFLRSPHTKVAPAYRRRGIATAVYRWWLDSGRSLVTGARQSPAARALWVSMARSYRLVYIQIDHKRVLDLGEQPPESVLQQLNCRAVLLGRGASLDSFVTPLSAHRPVATGWTPGHRRAAAGADTAKGRHHSAASTNRRWP
jgi:GNAT superfamily N-acetyltransferase